VREKKKKRYGCEKEQFSFVLIASEMMEGIIKMEKEDDIGVKKRRIEEDQVKRSTMPPTPKNTAVKGQSKTVAERKTSGIASVGVSNLSLSCIMEMPLDELQTQRVAIESEEKILKEKIEEFEGTLNNTKYIRKIIEMTIEIRKQQNTKKPIPSSNDTNDKKTWQNEVIELE